MLTPPNRHRIASTDFTSSKLTLFAKGTLPSPFGSYSNMASAAKIPVIDISATGEEEQAKVAKELVEAAIEHGFVYIRNKGADIPGDAVENAFNLVRSHFRAAIWEYWLNMRKIQGRRIFGAPVAEKQRCTIQTNNRGWSSMNYETLDPENQRVSEHSAGGDESVAVLTLD